MFRFLIFTIIAASIAFGIYIYFRGGNDFEIAYSNGKPIIIKTAASTDLSNQKPLSSPPSIIKAIYATSWSAGSPTKLNSLIKIIKATELNAIVIDLKDYSGAVTYDATVPEVDEYKAKDIRIPNINTVIKKLHDAGIYVIGRITVFQDPILARARPDLAVQNNKTGKTWTDNKGLSWIDPGSVDAWNYIVSIAKDAAARGFDEINFDYVRFPSDGDLTLMGFPFYKEGATKKVDMIREFFVYLRDKISDTNPIRANASNGARISADLFGLATINNDDLGIGQKIETAYENFDAVAPMIYPSHYGVGFLGHSSPAKYPYEVVRYSMDSAIKKWQQLTIDREKQLTEGSDPKCQRSNVTCQLSPAKLRPWLQDFDLLGVPYGATEVKAQIKALDDSFCINIDSPALQCKTTDVDKIRAAFGGWMLWDPANRYSVGALAGQ